MSGLQEAWRILDFLSNYPESTHIVSALQLAVHALSTLSNCREQQCLHQAISNPIGLKQCILHQGAIPEMVLVSVQRAT